MIDEGFFGLENSHWLLLRNRSSWPLDQAWNRVQHVETSLHNLHGRVQLWCVLRAVLKSDLFISGDGRMARTWRKMSSWARSACWRFAWELRSWDKVNTCCSNWAGASLRIWLSLTTAEKLRTPLPSAFKKKIKFRNYKFFTPEIDSTGQKTILRLFLGVYLDSFTLEIAFENRTFWGNMTKKSKFC